MMEKGLVVKKEIFIQKSNENIRDYYDIDPKVALLQGRKLERGLSARSIWLDPRISLSLYGPSKSSKNNITIHIKSASLSSWDRLITPTCSNCTQSSRTKTPSISSQSKIDDRKLPRRRRPPDQTLKGTSQWTVSSIDLQAGIRGNQLLSQSEYHAPRCKALKLCLFELQDSGLEADRLRSGLEMEREPQKTAFQ